MYQSFHTIASLYQWIEEDKKWTGAESASRNRYPIRFVLFDSFNDCYDFSNECSSHGVQVRSMDTWMREGDDDSMLTYSQLAKKFEEYIKNEPSKDYFLIPFSEIARFYENETTHKFDSLVRTIRGIEASEAAQAAHQRIYVPIVGMQSKMGKFKKDPDIFILEYSPEEPSPNYQLILTNGSFYGVKGLEHQHTLCQSMKEWVGLWKNGHDVKPRILSCSKVLFCNAGNAKPDNAFAYTICNNAFEFLNKGLGIDFGDIEVSDNDMEHWCRLASEVDANKINFFNYVAETFNVVSLEENNEFLKVWYDHQDAYLRWLLKTFYMAKHQKETYLKRVLRKTPSLSNSDFFSTIATLIFEEPQDYTVLNEHLKERNDALRFGAQWGATLSEEAVRTITAQLETIAHQAGYRAAMEYMSPISNEEKQLMTKWLGNGHIDRRMIEHLYPYLFEYTTPFSLNLTDSQAWANEYFTEYCKSKIANRATDRLSDLVSEMNASEVSFNSWRDQFKTVKTWLCNREDIDLYYWIDGLGVDWIPFVCHIIKQHASENVYLNEVLVATAGLPTRTENNKLKLQELCGDKLQKIGDIDNLAHQTKSYPNYIEKEFAIVQKAITDVLTRYNGKKIAFISDHGISYLSCREQGMNIAAIKGDHAGRCGVWEHGKVIRDNKYIVLDDGKTVCSLTHRSLTSKVPDGQGAHGGATPEEVLVPIIIVSNQKNTCNISAKLKSNVISLASPVLTYTIKGLQSGDMPVLEYNGTDYHLMKKSENEYESNRLNLVETATTVILKIGDSTFTDKLTIKTGVEEDDLFGDI